MKPANWDQIPKDRQKNYAWELLNSPRGIYIMSQALHYAMKTMSAEPPERKEVSNIQDMEILRETFFNFPIIDREEQEQMLEKLREGGALKK